MSQSGSKHTRLQDRLGYKFQERALLNEALHHPSLSGKIDNQRLEFLGDRVLGLVIAEELLRRDPKAKEGDLAPRLNFLVRKETCSKVAEELMLGDEIKLGRSESMSGGRRKMAILGDVMEAIIASIYLDGGFEKARDFVLQKWSSLLESVPEDAVDPKTRLQEFLQKRGLSAPNYQVISRDGPDHAPEFTVKAEALNEFSTGVGSNKKRAESNAAEALYKMLRDKHD